jgi:catechol 2,3-dioxygenase-like lactoylglutathione lyase family enzyme
MDHSGFGATTICQVAVVVHDIAKSAHAYATVFGLPVPPVMLTDPEEKAHTRYRGAPTTAQAKLAFFQLGTLQLELIEPVGGPSTWRDQLEQHGESVHHIAFRVPDMPAALAALNGQGMSTVQTGDYPGGCYGYVDSQQKLGVVLELLAKR